MFSPNKGKENVLMEWCRISHNPQSEHEVNGYFHSTDEKMEGFKGLTGKGNY